MTDASTPFSRDQARSNPPARPRLSDDSERRTPCSPGAPAGRWDACHHAAASDRREPDRTPSPALSSLREDRARPTQASEVIMFDDLKKLLESLQVSLDENNE